jgi:hypothetical protein
MFRKPPIRRGKHGIELHLGADERSLLERLGQQFDTLVSSDPEAPGLARLFPTAYPDDSEAEAFFTLMAREQLVARHREAADALVAAMGRTTLTEEQAEGFLRAVNVLRLVLGTQLGIETDDDDPAVPDDDPAAPAVALYHFLGWLLELLVAALAEDR